jgi:hypothetical protein
VTHMREKPRPFVPSPLRRQVFNSLHSLGHPGIKATAKLVSQHFVWSAIQKDSCTLARVCQPCQRSKVSRHIITPFGDIPLPPAASYTSTITHSVLYCPRKDFNTTSLLWTASRAGRKPSLLPTSQQRQCHAPYSPAGYHALVVHRPSRLTKSMAWHLRRSNAERTGDTLLRLGNATNASSWDQRKSNSDRASICTSSIPANSTGTDRWERDQYQKKIQGPFKKNTELLL